jgi:lipopolysaccharide export system ATP-binding protein
MALRTRTAEPVNPATQPAEGGRPRLIPGEAGLAAHNLGKQFKGRQVVRDVSLEVRRGEAVGLLGPNGAGKTTCFYIITGLLRADYGAVSLDGADITALPMYRRARLGIGYLPQEASIFRGLSVENNIRAVLEVSEPVRSQREARLDELLAEFSLSHLRRASRSRARSPPNRASCCSTSRWPASTRSTSRKSAGWSPISRTAGSAS